MVSQNQGLNAMLFGPPGAGKSTVVADAVSSEHARELIIINFDGDMSSLEDRTDIYVWPGGDENNGVIRDWRHFKAFSDKLVRTKHPFKTIQFDTISSAYDLAYKQSISTGNPNRDGRSIFGDANDLILEVVREWATISRERGINVVFICHAEEKQSGENGPILLRPSVTPGVVKGMYQAVSMIGCLQEKIGPGNHRKLTLHNTAKVVAKIHQPKTGPQIPLEITDPDIGRIIEHVRKVRPYPQKEKP